MLLLLSPELLAAVIANVRGSLDHARLVHSSIHRLTRDADVLARWLCNTYGPSNALSGLLVHPHVTTSSRETVDGVVRRLLSVQADDRVPPRSTLQAVARHLERLGFAGSVQRIVRHADMLYLGWGLHHQTLRHRSDDIQEVAHLIQATRRSHQQHQAFTRAVQMVPLNVVETVQILSPCHQPEFLRAALSSYCGTGNMGSQLVCVYDAQAGRHVDKLALVHVSKQLMAQLVMASQIASDHVDDVRECIQFVTLQLHTYYQALGRGIAHRDDNVQCRQMCRVVLQFVVEYLSSQLTHDRLATMVAPIPVTPAMRATPLNHRCANWSAIHLSLYKAFSAELAAPQLTPDMAGMHTLRLLLDNQQDHIAWYMDQEQIGWHQVASVCDKLATHTCVRYLRRMSTESLDTAYKYLYPCLAPASQLAFAECILMSALELYQASDRMSSLLWCAVNTIQQAADQVVHVPGCRASQLTPDDACHCQCPCGAVVDILERLGGQRCSGDTAKRSPDMGIPSLAAWLAADGNVALAQALASLLDVHLPFLCAAHGGYIPSQACARSSTQSLPGAWPSV